MDQPWYTHCTACGTERKFETKDKLCHRCMHSGLTNLQKQPAYKAYIRDYAARLRVLTIAAKGTMPPKGVLE